MTNSLSGEVVCGASLSRGRAYNTPKLLSILQRDGKRKSGKSDARERDQREKSMAGNEGKLTAFITAFSPCHGLSLRHSLHAIERQAICLSPSHPLAALYKHALIRLRIPAFTCIRMDLRNLVTELSGGDADNLNASLTALP